MKLGAVYYEQKMWDRAIDAFRRVVALEPTNLRARYFLATTYMDAGKDAEARAELERILRADPRSIDARVQLGFLHGRAKRYDEAIAILREAVNLEPKRPELFLYLGTAYFRAKQYDRAAETLQEGLGLDDKQKDLHFQLGVVYEKQAKFDDAVSSFRRVIALDPKHAEAYNYVGYMYAERGQNLDEAITAHRQGARARARERLLHRQSRLGVLPAGQYPRGAAELKRAVDEDQGQIPSSSSTWATPTSRTASTRTPLAAWEKAAPARPGRRRGQEEGRGPQGPPAPGQG